MRFPFLQEYETFSFPDPDPEYFNGVIASGGNLSPGMLLSAYRQGIFPWYSEGEPILWWSPDPRFVLKPCDFHVSKSMHRTLNSGEFTVSYDRDFRTVMAHCQRAKRPKQKGTWITRDIIEGYSRLHDLGYAHSVEVWNAEGILAGGLYGVNLGRLFCGESMFSLEPNASKTGFITLARDLFSSDFHAIDCQVYTDYLASFGAKEILRSEYLKIVSFCLQFPTSKESWGDRFGRK